MRKSALHAVRPVNGPSYRGAIFVPLTPGFATHPCSARTHDGRPLIVFYLEASSPCASMCVAMARAASTLGMPVG